MYTTPGMSVFRTLIEYPLNVCLQEHSEDPPAYREARRKAIVAREEEEAERMEREIHPIQEEVERALEKKQREKFKKSPYAKMVGGSIEGGEEVSREEEERWR